MNNSNALTWQMLLAKMWSGISDGSFSMLFKVVLEADHTKAKIRHKQEKLTNTSKLIAHNETHCQTVSFQSQHQECKLADKKNTRWACHAVTHYGSVSAVFPHQLLSAVACVSTQIFYRQMFRSVAQKPHVVYLCYKRRLFCISHSHSCSTNIINLKGKRAGIDSLALQQQKKKKKKNLKSFLKKIWIKWIVSLCDEMAVARHFGDTWS